MEKKMAINLFLETSLRFLHNAEIQIHEALRKMAKAAKNPKLRKSFLKHQEQTAEHVKRLEKALSLLDISLEKDNTHNLEGVAEKAKEFLKGLIDKSSVFAKKGIAGLLEQGTDMVQHFSETELSDFALVGSAQQVEHFEIASYKSLILFLDKIGYSEIVELLEKTLEEEEDTSELLTDIAQEELEVEDVAMA